MGVMNASVLKLREHSSLDHLYEQIDYNQFLLKEGMMEWSRKTGLPPSQRDSPSVG